MAVRPVSLSELGVAKVAVAVANPHQAELLEISRDRRLGRVEPERAQPRSDLFLAPQGLASDELEQGALTLPFHGATLVGASSDVASYFVSGTLPDCTTVTYGGSPGAQNGNGTMGRFRYFPSLKVFAVVNAWDQNAFTLRLTQ